MPLLGQEKPPPEGMDLRQALALQEWLADNYAVKLKNTGGQLELASLIIAEGSAISEKINSVQQMGRCSSCKKPRYPLGISYIFNGKYSAARSWGIFYLRYSNAMGIVTGTSDQISLDRAYLGYRLMEGEGSSFEIDVGRRFVGDLLSSTVQFNTRMDGIDFRYATVYPSWAQIYLTGTAFLVDANAKQWAYGAELGLLQIADSGLNFQLSFIDWDTGGSSYVPGKRGSATEDLYCKNNPRFRFRNIQPQLNYQWNSKWGERVYEFVVYAGASYNLAARACAIVNEGRPQPGSIGKCCTPIEWTPGNQYGCLSGTDCVSCDGCTVGCVDPNCCEGTPVVPSGGCELCPQDCCCPPICMQIGKEPWAFFVGLTFGKPGRVGEVLADIHYEYVQAQAIPQFDVAGISLGNCNDFDFYSSGLGKTNFHGVAARLVYQVTQHISLQGIYQFATNIKDIACPTRFSKGKFAVTYAF